MAETPKPIKRSPQLAPLSREHHEGLLFAWKLRQGLAKNIEAARLAAFAQWFWQHHFALHFQKEEQAFPLVLSTEDALLQQMLREHEEIKNRIAESGQYGDLKKFEELAQLVTDHIRFEERQLFAAVEETATPEQLQELSEKLADDERTAEWGDPFWLRAT